METVLRIANEDEIIPSEILFHELHKVISKGFINSKPEVLKACSRIISDLSEQEKSIDDLLNYGDGKVISHFVTNFQQLKQQRNTGAIEDLLEILHVLVENSEKARENCACLATAFLSIILDKIWSFGVKLESSKLLNLFLEENDMLKENVLKSSECIAFMDSFGQCIKEVGDYELQATIMEIIFRLLATSEDKEKFASYWFPLENIQNSFLSIRNEEFETDGRRFLNNLNASDPMKQLVFSFPALVFSLGRYQLKKPLDSKVTDFWVDFNVGSQSVSTFVNDDSSKDGTSDWEMIIIKKDEIRDFRVNINEEKTILILKLYEPAYQLAPFCPEAAENYVKIIFDQKIHSSVSKALKKLFGQVKYVELPISSPSISSTPGRNLRTAMAISPLAVHSTNMSSVVKTDHNNEISDATVSSSSHVEPEERKETVDNEIDNLDGKDDTNQVVDDQNQNETPDEKSNEAEDNETDENDVTDEVVAAEDEKPSEATEDQDDHIVPETQENQLVDEDEKVHFEVEDEAASDKKDYDIVDEKELDEKPPVKKQMSIKLKKGKKLMRTNATLFQDSPDENYEAAPIKTHQEQQKKKSMTNAAKSKIKIAKVQNPELLAVYDFEEDEEPEEETTNKKNKPKCGKASQKNVQQPENQSKISADDNNDEPEETGRRTRRSRRQKYKKINYKEASTSDFEDFKESSKCDHVDEDANDEMVEVKDQQPAKGKRQPKRNNRKKSVECPDRKSVSFVSPVVETVDEHHSPLENLVTKSVLKSISSGTQDFPLTPSDGGDPDVIAFERAMAKAEKMNRVKEWNERYSQQGSVDNDDNCNGDLTSTPIDSDAPKMNRNLKDKSGLPKPFERNALLGWGKMNIKRDPKDYQVYDFEDEIEGGEKEIDTPWSQQKKKKERVKKTYGIKKEGTKRSEDGGDDTYETTKNKNKNKNKGKSQKSYSDELDESEEQSADDSQGRKNKSNKGKTQRKSQTVSYHDQELDVSKQPDLSCDEELEVEEKKSRKGRPKKRSKKPTKKKDEKIPMKKMKLNSSSDKRKLTASSIVAAFDWEDESFNDEVSQQIEASHQDLTIEETSAVTDVVPSPGSINSSSGQSPGQSDITDTPMNDEPSSAVERFYGKLNVKEEKTNPKKSAENTPIISRTSKSKMTISEEESNIDFSISLKGSQEEVVSSVESQNASQEFIDTPNDETPMNDKKGGYYKNWAKQLNTKLDNIEAIMSKKQQGKRKLWKSPVVIVPEDAIPPMSPEVKVPKVVNKQKKQKSKNTVPTVTTPLMKPIEDSNRTLSHTPDIGLCEGVDAFAKFCRTMLGQQGDADVDNSTTIVAPSQSFEKESQNSPVKKKKKVEEIEKVEHISKDHSPEKDNTLPIPLIPPQTMAGKDPSRILQFDEIMESQEEKDLSSDDEEDVTPIYYNENNTSFNNISFGLDDISGNEGNEIQTLLQTFGSNISKSINTKKQSTEQFVNNVMKITCKKVKAFWQKQAKQREANEERIYNHFISNFDEWYQLRLQKDEKIQKCIDQLKDVVKQQNDEDRQRIKRMRETYVKCNEQKKKQAAEDLSLQDTLQNQIRNEIKKLKKQMLNQSKAAEVGNIRRSLQAMLNKV